MTYKSPNFGKNVPKITIKALITTHRIALRLEKWRFYGLVINGWTPTNTTTNILKLSQTLVNPKLGGSAPQSPLLRWGASPLTPPFPLSKPIQKGLQLNLYARGHYASHNQLLIGQVSKAGISGFLIILGKVVCSGKIRCSGKKVTGF